MAPLVQAAYFMRGSLSLLGGIARRSNRSPVRYGWLSSDSA